MIRIKVGSVGGSPPVIPTFCKPSPDHKSSCAKWQNWL
jgi:hypothetical protein